MMLHATTLTAACGSGDDAPGAGAPATDEPTVSDTGPPPPTDSAAPTPTPTDTGTLPTLPTLTGDTGEPLPPCKPALSLAASPPSAPPSSLVTLTTGGGTGAYRYALSGDAAGVLDPVSGFYLSAEEAGAVDTITVTDEACAGEASVEVQTVAALQAHPAEVEVLPGTAFTVSATGGSGSYGCVLAEAASGATLSGCDYTAGGDPGFDRVVITDDVTGESVDARITVDPDATVELVGAEEWLLPLGAHFVPESVGGSGELEISGGAGVVQTQGAGIDAIAAGTATVTVSDPFTGFSTDVQVTVTDIVSPPSDWYGQQSQLGNAEAADIDGDGYTDVVFALAEINHGAYYAGGVVVYAGGPDGLQPEVVWETGGTSLYEFVGRSLALDDIDGDGEIDLLVGADGADWTDNDIGEVRVHYGVAGGWFDDEPGDVLRGVNGYDRMGSALTTCDLDGDGWTDIIAGAYAAEDRDLDDYPNTMGAVMVYPGSSQGLYAVPTQVRYGHLPVDGSFEPVENTRIGEYGLAAGDVDGDGLCDIAVASYTRGWEEDELSNYGFVQVYTGQAGTLLSDEPVRMYANDDDSYAELGRELALADLDGDGLDDVFAAAPYMDGTVGGSQGLVAVWLAASDDGRPATEPVFTDEADYSIWGRRNGDYAGRDVHVGDVTGDGVPDVVVGEPQGQDLDDLYVNHGRVAVWSGAELLALDPGSSVDDEVPWASYVGETSGDFFGQALAPLPDLDGDGTPEMFVHAGRSDVVGVNVGLPYIAWSDGSLASLDMPGGPAGHDHGRGVVLFDADADGELDLLVGSPEDGDPDLGNATGAVTMFAGVGGDAFDAVGVRIGDYGTRGGGDRLGYGLAVTDFDGDGIDDLAALARTDTMLSDLDPLRYANPDECAPESNRNGAGMVAVWRGGSPIDDRDADWVFWTDEVNGNLFSVVGGFDHDGDGRQDLAVGSRNWDDYGAFAIVYGEPVDPSGLTHVVCSADVWTSEESGSWLGDSLAAVPDLDNDGCDELAVGAPLEDQGESNQGVVRLLWGSCGGGVQLTALAPDLRSVQAGESLAAGTVDGDAWADLVVGGDGTVDNGDQIGTVWVVPGTWLRSLPRTNAPPGPLPGAALQALTPTTGGHYGLSGPSPTSDFGEAVALLPDPARPGQHAVWVGTPDGGVGGTFQGGGALAYRWGDDPLGTGLPGLQTLPFAVLGGEPEPTEGNLGEVLVGAELDGQPMLLVGAPTSSQQGVAVGGVYAFGQ